MTKTTDITAAAMELIEAIASDLTELEGTPLDSIRYALEDGEALAHLGVEDEDQPMVEEAHDIVTGWITAGHTTWEKATGRVTAIYALRVTDSGLLEPATIERVPGTETYADTAGNILTDSGRQEVLMGWGEKQDGKNRILVDEAGRDAYYIRIH